MDLDAILNAVQSHKISIQAAKDKLAGFEDLTFAKVDLARKRRNGFPEVIYGEAKTVDQIQAIAAQLLNRGEAVLVTRVSQTKADVLCEAFPMAQYHAAARILTINYEKPTTSAGYIAVVTAGTSDIGVAEEAAITAEAYGNAVKRIYDVGVAGIQRLFARLDEIRQANVVIVIAGMEGALTSVVGGLVDVPVIAVPTSVGYGASFNGLAALLGMLNSCSSGVTVTNIDNGFGAAYTASMINQPRHHLSKED